MAREMEMLRKELSIREIAGRLGISVGAVMYHVNPEYRVVFKEKQRRKTYKLYKEGKLWIHKHPEEFREWRRKYEREKYRSDPEFRRKVMERVNRWQRRKWKEDEAWRERRKRQIREWKRKKCGK